MTDPLEIAGELIVAEREHKTIAQFSNNDPDFDLDTAYRLSRPSYSPNSTQVSAWSATSSG